MSDVNGSVNTGNPSDWAASIPADLKPVVESKGWHQKPANEAALEAIKSFVSAEKLIGTKRLEAPQDGWDDAKWGEFYKGVGAPDDPNGYKLPDTVQVEDEDFAGWYKQTAKDLGFNQRQYAKGAELWQKYVGGRVEAATKTEAEAIANADAALRKEWGPAYDGKIASGRAAVAALQDKLGLNPEFLTQVENKIGYAPLLKLFSVLADDYGIGRESRAPGQGGGNITPDAASAELRNLNADDKFRAAILNKSDPGHADALSKWERLIDLGGKLSGR